MKATFEMHGFDELKKKLEEASKTSDTVLFSELFTEPFMKKHSKFSDFEDLVKFGGYSTDADEFKKISNDEFDKFIKANTDFDSWKGMQQSAANEWTAKMLGF
jgi:hypothetical protein